MASCELAFFDIEAKSTSKPSTSNLPVFLPVCKNVAPQVGHQAIVSMLLVTWLGIAFNIAAWNGSIFIFPKAFDMGPCNMLQLAAKLKLCESVAVFPRFTYLS